MPVYNIPKSFFMAAVASVQQQTSRDWELCIVNATDPSQRHNMTDMCKHLASPDGRIKVRHTENLGISGNSNLALEMATGNYVAFLDADDLLAPNAVQRVIDTIMSNPDADFVYSDEDKVDPSGRHFDPYRKPDWSPDTFMSKMYTCHLGVYRTSLVRALGGLRPQFDGAQDYDLVLRLCERTDSIYHIPEILYHWRVHPQSTASGNAAKPYAHTAAMNAIREAIARRGEPGYLDALSIGMHNVHYFVKEFKKVSIIIPAKDAHALTDDLLNSIFNKTDYPNFEVVLVDNRSAEPETGLMIEKWLTLEPKRFRCIRDDSEFNYSEINNRAAAQVDGEFLLFLNNDTLVISPQWVTDMVGYAQRQQTGVVGAKLLYPDNTVQHAGVATGIGGSAGHLYHGAKDTDTGNFGDLLTVVNYSALTAACIMLRRDVFEAVGGFEPSLRIAFNDVDLCLKVRGSGYYNVYLPFVKLYHFESKTRGYEDSPEKKQRFASEVSLLRERWPGLDRDPFHPSEASTEAASSRSETPSPAPSYVYTVVHNPYQVGPRVVEARV